MNKIRKSILASLIAVPAFVFAAETFDQLPEVISSRMPVVSSSSEGKVALSIQINEQGYVTSALLKSGNDSELAQACLQAVRSWRYSPAIKDGKAVAATFIQPFSFGADSVVTEDYSRKPEATHRVSPEIPESLRHVTGTVVVAVRLDADGRVESTSVKESTHEELNALATSAILDWSFSPAVKSGKPVASLVYVPLRFVGKEVEKVAAEAKVADNRELRIVRQAMPEIPEELAQVGGEAKIEFTVDAYGFVSNPTVVSTDEPRLAELAKQAVLNWKFKPVVRNGQAQAARVVQPFNFGERAVVAQALDKMPKPTRTVSPELPDNLRGVRGRVAVLFTVKDTGEVDSVEVKDTTQPEINTPILEAARKWAFSPAVKDGKAVGSKVVVPFLVGSE